MKIAEPRAPAPDIDCSTIEERLIDGLGEGRAGLDAETLAHLARCPSCARAQRELFTAAALAHGVLRRSRPLVPAAPFLIAASLVLAFTAFLASYSHGEGDEVPLTLLPADDAIVRQVGDHRAQIDVGSSTFVLSDPRSVVETPFGDLSCPGGCEFTVSIERDECGLAPPAIVGLTNRGLRMSITVAAGAVASDLNGHPAILAQAHSLTLPFDHYR